MPLDDARRLPAPRRCRRCGRRAAPAALQQVERRHGAAAGRQHRIDHQHEARRRGAPAASSSTATRRRSSRRAAGRCGRRARAARARAPRRACRARRAAPARRRRPSAIRRPSAGPSGVSTVTAIARHVAQRFGGEQHADARRRAAEMFGRRALVAQRRRARRARADDRRCGPARLTHTIQFLSSHACSDDVAADRLRAARALRSRARAAAVDRISLVVTGGTVITAERRAARCCRPAPSRSTAPTSSTSTRREAIAARYQRRRDRSTRASQIVLPGLDQHPHARADGDVPRPRRRSRADGLAAEVHLSRPRRRRCRRRSCGSARGSPRSR